MIHLLRFIFSLLLRLESTTSFHYECASATGKVLFLKQNVDNVNSIKKQDVFVTHYAHTRWGRSRVTGPRSNGGQH